MAFVRLADGRLVELDGLKQGPLVVKEKTEDLIKDASQILLKRIEDGYYSESLAVLVLCKKPTE